MLPFAFLFGTIALVIQYWEDKVMLLRYMARPELLSHSLDESMLRVIPLGAVLYAFANWIFFYNLEPASRVPGIIGIATSAAWFILPWKKLGKLLHLRKTRVLQDISSLSESDKSYEEAAVYFPEDYDRSNPLTQAEGEQAWLDLIRRKRGPEAADMMAEAMQSGPRPKQMVHLFASNAKELVRSFLPGQFINNLPRHHTKVCEESRLVTAEVTKLKDFGPGDVPQAPVSTL